jgi:hypothetical protein
MRALLWHLDPEMERRNRMAGNNGDCAWWFWVGDLSE